MAQHAETDSPTLDLERDLIDRGHASVAGVDEVGRGSWAGPIVAAAVVLPASDCGCQDLFHGVRDSKLLTAASRRELFHVITRHAVSIGIGWASHHRIDTHGIAAANRGAMLRAVRNLRCPVEALVVDHLPLPDCPLPQICIPKAESRSLSVAAASIVAKVVRDRWMERWSSRFPEYGFDSNKGYGTAHHRAAVERLGATPIHRLSFRPLAPAR